LRFLGILPEWQCDGFVIDIIAVAAVREDRSGQYEDGTRKPGDCQKSNQQPDRGSMLGRNPIC
jgi:hypothetical protein